MTAVGAGPPDVVDSWERLGPDDAPPLVVLDRLADYLDEIGLGSGPLSAERIGDGHSQITYLLSRGPVRVVLRRPPRPPIPKGAHDVQREARVLAGLRDADVRAPRLLAHCEDETIIGSEFVLMEYVDGLVIGQQLPEPFDSRRDGTSIMEELIDAMVELHACVPAEHGLGDLGRPDEYLERQLGRSKKVWSEARVREVSEIDLVGEELERRMPPRQAPAFVHGDLRLGNVLFAAEPPPRLLTILDWETTTQGDPLTDLGYLLGTYPGRGETGLLLSLSAVGSLDGFPSRRALANRYAERSTRSLENLNWYVAFALWRVAITLERLYARYVQGTLDDDFYAEMETEIPSLARQALTFVRSETDLIDEE